MDKNCSTCGWNDDGLCDKKGILVNDTDRCKKWENYEKGVNKLCSVAG